MNALILAAGRGERLRPLTDLLPKPLIAIGDATLLDRHLRELQRAGVRRCVINVAHLGHLIEARIGSGAQFGMTVAYSREPPGALETGGGIKHALSLLERAPFIVVNGDVLTDFEFSALPGQVEDAHLVLVPNPPDHQGGDFALVGTRVDNASIARFTFAGIAVYHPRFFEKSPPVQRFPLTPLLRAAAAEDRVTGQVHRGLWMDIGTPERLTDAKRFFTSK
ncbi:MAG: nucleotidyltransferase family protein [Gammaproteobacteria bacterium]|nr:nucleotidyltransferase family protein [Gammaproteobacteria bacterium]